MITRRTFLTGLATTTALVAVPGATLATVSIEDLLERKMRETQARMVSDLNQMLYGDESLGIDHPDGLASLLTEPEREEIKQAARYEWTEVAYGLDVTTT